MLCAAVLVGWFLRVNSTRSPSRTRMKFPGTCPPKVQKVYSTPSASRFFSSTVSSSTLTVEA